MSYRKKERVQYLKLAILDPSIYDNEKFWSNAKLELGEKVEKIVEKTRKEVGTTITYGTVAHLRIGDLIKVLGEHLKEEYKERVEIAINASKRYNVTVDDIKIPPKVVLDSERVYPEKDTLPSVNSGPRLFNGQKDELQTHLTSKNQKRSVSICDEFQCSIL